MEANQGPNYFRQFALKAAGEAIPMLTEENFPVWKDKVLMLFDLKGVRNQISGRGELSPEDDLDLQAILMAKLDSKTHTNIINKVNSLTAPALWQAILDKFAFSQSANRARWFNHFLHLTFSVDEIDAFITSIKTAMARLLDVGIELPQGILAYLILFKFPTELDYLKKQIMHSDKSLTSDFVLDHLTQCLNETAAENKDSSKSQIAGRSNETVLLSKNRPKFRNQRYVSKCRPGYHDPRSSHPEADCFHLNPDKAPEWWHEKQNGWKSQQNKNADVAYYYSLISTWVSSLSKVSDDYILDSGASAHIFIDKTLFSNLKTLDQSEEIKTGKEGSGLPIEGVGTVTLTFGNKVIKLDKSLYVPSIVVNLISAGALSSNGCQISAKNDSFQVRKNNKLVMDGKIIDNLFVLNSPNQSKAFASYLAPGRSDDLLQLHQSFGHAHIKRLTPFIKSSLTPTEIEKFECIDCITSKITRSSFKESSSTATKVFERLHLDIFGQINPTSKGHHKYFLTLFYSFSRYVSAFPLISKDKVAEVLIGVLVQQNDIRGYYPSLIVSDGGTEFVNKTLLEFYTSNGIKFETSEPYHPQHNGKAESQSNHTGSYSR